MITLLIKSAILEGDTMISTSIYRTIEQNAIADGKKCEMKGGYFKDTSLTVGAVKYFLQVLIVSQRLNYH